MSETVSCVGLLATHTMLDGKNMTEAYNALKNVISDLESEEFEGEVEYIDHPTLFFLHKSDNTWEVLWRFQEGVYEEFEGVSIPYHKFNKVLHEFASLLMVSLDNISLVSYNWYNGVDRPNLGDLQTVGM